MCDDERMRLAVVLVLGSAACGFHAVAARSSDAAADTGDDTSDAADAMIDAPPDGPPAQFCPAGNPAPPDVLLVRSATLPASLPEEGAAMTPAQLTNVTRIAEPDWAAPRASRPTARSTCRWTPRSAASSPARFGCASTPTRRPTARANRCSTATSSRRTSACSSIATIASRPPLRHRLAERDVDHRRVHAHHLAPHRVRVRERQPVVLPRWRRPRRSPGQLRNGGRPDLRRLHDWLEQQRRPDRHRRRPDWRDRRHSTVGRAAAGERADHAGDVAGSITTTPTM